jgi:hypothetical protein
LGAPADVSRAAAEPAKDQTESTPRPDAAEAPKKLS